MIDIRDINSLGASKCRPGAKNNKEQSYYLNYNKKDMVFITFLSI